MVDDGLSEFFGVLGDFRQGGCGDALESKLGLLNAKNEQANGTSVNYSLSELVIVLGDAREGESRSFLDGGVKLLKAVDEGIEGSGVDDCLCKVG